MVASAPGPKREAHPHVATDSEWDTMQTIFPSGVCDYSRRGVDQQRTIPWQTYQNDAAGGSVIYGGTPLGPPPKSH